MMFKNKSILITGGTGSFGKAMVKTLLNQYEPKKVLIFSRDELKQFEMQNSSSFKNFNQIIRYFIGDVRDINRLKTAFSEVDIVIHAAALKQVPAAEYNPFEAIKTNIIGAKNVIDAAISEGVKKVVALSTDKASAPINLYGATKLASDKLFVAANNYVGSNPIKFSVIRYGNVFGSRGSVIPFFKSNIKKEFLPVTDENMTRFSITLEQGVSFVINCIEKMWGGEIFIPKIPSYKILDVVKAISSSGKYKIIGVRPGEKIHEEMITKTDALNTIEFDKYFVILPSLKLWNIKEFIENSDSSIGKFCSRNFSYNSKNNKVFLTVDDLKKLIEEST